MVATWKQQLDKVFSGSDVPLSVETQVREDPLWDNNPFVFLVGGVPTEFFSIGHLGKAINRSSNTLRAWEREGTIPKSPYTKPSDDPRGRRRMYTRAMVEGIVQIAKEEKVPWLPDKGFKLSQTQFTPRVLALFQQLTRK